MGRRIPKDLSDAINKAWPDGEVEPFDDEESYYPEIRLSLERDLWKIPGATLHWQTQDEHTGSFWDDDWEDVPPSDTLWQSFRTFFLSPKGGEFHYECEGSWPDSMLDDDRDGGDPDEEGWDEPGPEECWFGCLAVVSLRAPFAIVGFGELSQNEYGSSVPDPENISHQSPRAGSPGGWNEKSIQKLEKLRARVVQVLAKRGIQTLDPSVLQLTVPGLVPGEDAFLQKPIRVRDAFFFQGP